MIGIDDLVKNADIDSQTGKDALFQSILEKIVGELLRDIVVTNPQYEQLALNAQNVAKAHFDQLVELIRQVRKEPLSNMWRAEWLTKHGNALVAEWCDQNFSVAYFMFDIRKFGCVNKHGHDAGDRCLVKVATVIRETFSARCNRKTGLRFRPYRRGGDEFVVIAQGLSPEACESILEEIDSGVQRIEFAEGKTLLGMHHGYAICNHETSPRFCLSQLTQHAESNLQKSKRLHNG